MNGVNDFIQKPLVSVILNCYNGAEFLREAIDSVYAQTYPNWEIIFWDNCSVDKSKEIALSYDDRVKYHLADTNTSLGAARNLAISKAKGDYIAIIDCDDIWSNPDKLSIQVDFLEKNNDYILCYGDYEEIFVDGTHFSLIKTLYDSGNIFEKLLFQFDISIITTMLRSSLLKESGLQFDSNIKASEEYCLFMQLASRYKIGVIKEVLAKYRVHSASLTTASLSILGYERRYTLNKIIANKPLLKDQYSDAFKEAYARADYYDSRWFMSQRKHLEAFKKLSKVAFVSKRYFILLFLTLFPSAVWDSIHLKKRNRT